jgi:hypothetical protein
MDLNYVMFNQLFLTLNQLIGENLGGLATLARP